MSLNPEAKTFIPKINKQKVHYPIHRLNKNNPPKVNIIFTDNWKNKQLFGHAYINYYFLNIL